MDLTNRQNEFEEMITKLKAEFEDMTLNLQLDRSDSDITRKQLRQQNDKYIASQQNLLDKGSLVEQNDIAVSMEVELVALLKKKLHDQHAAFTEKMKQERAVFNQVLSKVLEENEANLNKERAKFDSFIKQAEELLDKELDNESSKFKSLIDSLVEQEEARGNMNVEEEQDGMYISKHNMFILMNNECGPNVVMRFKIHSVKEVYPDLKKYYDSREEALGQLTFTKGENSNNLVEFVTLWESLRPMGYIGETQLYYLDPAPESEPSTGLVLIHGQEEVNELVLAHEQQGTRICHLYLVKGYNELHNDMETDFFVDEDEWN